MISKELLDEVLKNSGDLDDEDTILKIKTELSSNFLNGTQLTFWTDVAQYHINIYELSDKCKKWASKQGYPLYIRWAKNIVHVGLTEENGDEKIFFGNTYGEADGVLQACEWIYNRVFIREGSEQ